jgi:hypothetical protein
LSLRPSRPSQYRSSTRAARGTAGGNVGLKLLQAGVKLGGMVPPQALEVTCLCPPSLFEHLLRMRRQGGEGGVFQIVEHNLVPLPARQHRKQINNGQVTRLHPHSR